MSRDLEKSMDKIIHASKQGYELRFVGGYKTADIFFYLPSRRTYNKELKEDLTKIEQAIYSNKKSLSFFTRVRYYLATSKMISRAIHKKI